ncbi:non-ribosomal peptide synthetase [Rhizobacter sp. OV335]|uniref:non-ribosomal peptide synthetase n=1 Tax=Rhizobacter sp. OV335 TaxID=1500264 RepID=UPI00091B9F9A|nr:non-ribosomal peptide synthetase [Rhizobacter sp. OV335]SHN31632.1 non-ribosomal peptide synthase domain TIGR01720/amino acid adenylation domain-containing protein [Rhizobacter sp. OV335]
MSSRARDIAERFTRLPAERRSAFLALLREQGVDFGRLPIVPWPSSDSSDEPDPMSHAQARQWFLWRLDPAGTAYHIAGALRLSGRLDVAALRASFDVLVERHESLRTVFDALPDGLAQPRVLPASTIELAERDTDEASLAAELQRINAEPFDLARGPLLRLALLRLAPQQHVLAVVMHHIVSDGASLQVIVGEFVALYQAQVEGRSITLPPLPIRYADYARWQRHGLAAGEQARQLAHWTAQLGADHPVLQLPTDRPRVAEARLRAAQHAVDLPPALVQSLRQRAEAHHATLFAALLAGWQALLARWTGQHDLRVGVPIANRQRVETEGLVGFFVNTQVLRNVVNARMPLAQVLAQARDAALGAQEHQDLPFEQLVDALQPERSLGTHPLFQVLYNHQRHHQALLAQLPGLRVQEQPLGELASQFELTLDTLEHPDGRVQAVFSYADALFEPATIARLARQYLAMLAALAWQPQTALGDVDLLDAQERAQLQAWGVNAPQPAGGEWVHQAFERHALSHPDAPALLQGNGVLSYGELNRRANRLAHRLIAQGVGAETRVAVSLPRSFELIVALLAVLKAGGAYVPMDPSHPAERLAFTREDCGAALLLTLESVRDLEAQGDIDIDSDPAVPLHAGSLAYVIYTSGSTGRPKGVAVAHGPLAMHCRVTGVLYEMRTATRELHFLSFSFDGAHERLLTVLGCGASLLLRDEALWTPAQTLAAMRERGVTNAGFPPAYLQALARDHSQEREDDPFALSLSKGGPEHSSVRTEPVEGPARFGHNPSTDGPSTSSVPAQVLRQAQDDRALRQAQGERGAGAAPLALLSFGGEAMPRAGLQAVREHLRPRLLINGYGPTEAVVTPVLWKARGDAAAIDTPYVPIGRPCGDRTARVLDADMNLLPPGAAGELYLGGAGLARGYLGRAGLTAERFVADPFDANGGRLYRTGDLVRWIVDADADGEGQLEYLGRIDQQVKVRGFRIELGEVEARLMPLPGVAEAVASVQQGPGGARLVAHVTARTGAVLVPAELRAQLAAQLPDYMVPAAIAVVDALPLNPNGKVDRRALPFIEAQVDGDRYEAPQGEVEQALATLWAELLGVPRVGRHDNFFDLGGDSILSLQIVARMRGLGWALTPRQVFERQTPALLAPLAQAEVVREARTERDPVGEVPLLPIQQEFFALEMQHRDHWNQSLLLHSREPLQTAALAQALAALLRHHDSLRLRFTQDAEGGWHQAYAAYDETAQRELLWVRRASGAQEIEALCDEVQRSLDLSRGPLLRGLAIEVADGGWRLMLAVHHLVVDGVSWRILLEDLQTAYAQCVARQPVELPPKTSSYQEWSRTLVARMPIRDAAVDGDPGLASGLRVARPHGSNLAGEQTTTELRLDAAHTEALLKRAPSAYRTQVNDLLLTALGRALCGWSGHERIRIDLEGHGREDIADDIDLSRTVGWFTSLFPVVLDPLGEPGAALKRVKEALRAVPLRGLAHGLLKHSGPPEVQQALRALPPSQVVFNYLGQFDGSFDAAAAWRPAQERSGASVHESAPQAHEFSIDGQVYDGQLALSVRYSPARHDTAEVQRFVDAFRGELLALIEHCSGGALGVTPSDFPLARIDQATLDGLKLPLPNLDDLYPLSPMQAGMLFQSLVDERGEAYRTQLRVDLDGLDVARFRAAWTTVLARHEVLRSGFIAQPPLQWVARRVELPWSVQDWRDRTGAEVDAFAQAELVAPLDLAKPPLMRVALLRTQDDRHHVVWTAHHLLLDGWSSSLLLGEVLRAYDRAALPAPLGRFRDHIAWLQSRDPAAGEAHWRAQLAPLASPTLLASALRRPQPARPGQGGLRRTLPVQPLIDAARRERVTINTLVQAAWALVLARCTGQRTVCFGSTVAGRPAELPGAQQMLGLFINTLPVLATLRPAQRLGDWLRALQAQGLAAREHEHTPLVEIQRWAGQGGQALFDSLLVFENYPIDAALRQAPPGGLRVGASSTRDDTHYALTLALHQGEALAFDWRYAHDAFDEATVAQLAGQVERVLAAFVREPDACVGALSVLADGERDGLLRQGENGLGDVPGEVEPVHRTIERLARAQPEATALVFGDVELSRGELNAQANRLAHRLIAQGVRPQACVGIALERSVEMIVAVLAVLKAGAAYVPLDPAYPAERRLAMVEDSGIAPVLTEVDADALKDQPASDPQLPLHLDQLAYVIHTSGSTGRPKGVAVSHRALARHAQAAANFFGLVPGDRVLQFATLNFDAFVEQLFAPLAVGAAVVLRGPEVWDSATFRREVIARRVSVADLTTAYWQLLAQDFAREPGHDLGALRQVHVGGEAMSPEGLKAWRDAGLSHIRLLNAYGPTEATVTASALDCTPFVTGDVAWPASVPIGTALPGRALRIVDADLHPVVVGVAGELCIGGPLLARGYLGRPGLTAERFIADPFDGDGGRLYRTGDLVRWTDGGQIEYLGRVDHQVKLRGFRIELGEIEAALLAQPELREAVVLARPSAAGPRLVAYVSLQAGASIEPHQLRERLAAVLPEPMRPSALMILPTLPLTPAGKLDRQALPEPEAAAEAEHVPPLGDTEQALAAIWCELLGVPRVGRHDHFFELGGHSLIAVRLVAELRHRLGLEVALRTVFDHPTLADLAAALPARPAARTADRLGALLDELEDSLEDTLE